MIGRQDQPLADDDSGRIFIGNEVEIARLWQIEKWLTIEGVDGKIAGALVRCAATRGIATTDVPTPRSP